MTEKDLLKNQEISQILSQPEIIDLDRRNYFEGILQIVPTPLGNLQDLSIRSFYALEEADVIVCEDTRVTGKLFKLLKNRNFKERIQDIETDNDDKYNDDMIFRSYKNNQLKNTFNPE